MEEQRVSHSRLMAGLSGSRYGLSSSTLKLFACITMLIDHTGGSVVLQLLNQPAIRANAVRYNQILSVYTVMRQIGRLAFPIFCFLIVEGYYHTHDVRKYMRRLFVFSLISEIPFDLALKPSWFYPLKQNVYFTLLIGLWTIWTMDQFRFRRMLRLVIALCGMTFARGLMTDYSFRGIFLAAAIAWETYAPPSFILCYLYNGKRGLRLKYFFYLFYPVHLMILGLIRWLCIAKLT